MRVPNASVPLLARDAPVQHHSAGPHPYSRHQAYPYGDEDDEEPPQPPRSGPESRRSRSRRDVSPQSHHYRSTPVSRRSPRTSVSESEYETDATVESDDERANHPPRGKGVDVAPVSRSVMRERMNRNRVIYEEEEAGEDRHASSYGRRRSPSRQPSRHPSRHPSQKSSSKHERHQYQRPRDDYRDDEMLDDERSHYPSRRPSKGYHDHEHEGLAPRPPSIKRAHTTAGGSHMASSHSLGSSARRSTFDNGFGFPLHQSAPDRAARFLSCFMCKDKNSPAHETISLDCGHHMCHRCLKHSFRLSLNDPEQHMPPRCCAADIPPKHVAKLFDSDFKREWNRKLAEHSSRSRLFCPSRRCGEWIRPEDIRRDGGHHHGRCSRCKTKVCCTCHNRWHPPRDCPGNVEADRFFEQTRGEDRQQRCHRCDTVVDFKEGRNHMTWYGPSRAVRRASAPAFINIWCPSSRCGGESCTLCGSKWKSCDCPWFNESLDSEPTEYMDVPAASPTSPDPNPFAGHAKRFETAPLSPRAFRSDAGIPLTSSLRPRPSSYEEEAMLHQLQGRRDPKHARPFAEFPDQDREAAHARDRTPRTRRTVGDEYRRRPATVIVPPPTQMHPPPPPPRSAFDGPSSAFDYAGPGRAPRGMRHVSPDRWQAASRPASPERGRWHIPSRAPSRAQSRAPSRPRSPEGMAWGGRSRQQSPERGRWRTHSRAQSADRGALWRARSVGDPIYDTPDRELSPSAETRRHHSRFPSRAPSRVASRAASRVPSRAPSPPETRRAPSPPPSRRAPSPMRSVRSRRAPSRAATQRAPSPPRTHRSPSPDRRRSHTPARSRAQTPDRRRSHTPDARRTASMDHLADRFNPEARVNTPGMAGALAPLGAMGHLGPMMMMPPPPPPPSYAATQGGHLPMVPVPPPAAPGGRRHMMEDEVYSSIPGHRGATRSSGGLTRFHHEQEPLSAVDAAIHGGSPYAPHVRRRPPQATRVHGHELPRPSVLAGLAGPGRGLNRVFEWRNYVEPGIPEGEQPPSIPAQ